MGGLAPRTSAEVDVGGREVLKEGPVCIDVARGEPKGGWAGSAGRTLSGIGPGSTSAIGGMDRLGDADLRRLFAECKPDQSGRVSLRHLLYALRARTNGSVSTQCHREIRDKKGPQNTVPLEREIFGETKENGVAPDVANGRQMEEWSCTDGATIDYHRFREMMEEAAVASQEGMEDIDTVLLEKENETDLGTPPAMERNLVLSAQANGKLSQHHHDDLAVTLKRITAGGLAGMAAKSVVAPMDRVKILFQVTNEGFSFPKARKLVHDIMALEGPSGLWKGNSATMIRVFPYAGTQFMMFDTLKRRALARKARRDPLQPQRLSNMESLVSGSIAGAVSALVTYPLDMARTRLAVGVARRVDGHRHSMSVGTLLLSVVRKEGITALYRGVTPSIMGIIPYAGIAFSINEQAKHEVLVITGREPQMLDKLCIGAFAGLVAQSCTYPLEMVRRRMQTYGLVDQHSGVSKVFETSADRGTKAPGVTERLSIAKTLKVVVKEQGLRGLFKGLSMNWVKGPVGISISFTTFDFLKWKLKIT